MTLRNFRRRDLLQLPVLGAGGAAGAFLNAAAARAAATDYAACGEVMGYDPETLPKDIAGVAAFFVPGRYDYEWRGTVSERYPNGNLERGQVTVGDRELGGGISYEIDAEIRYRDGKNQEAVDKRQSITNVFSALDESIVFMTQSSFGSHHRGLVTALSGDRLVVTSFGLSDHRGRNLFGRWVFDKEGEDYRVHASVHAEPKDDWSLVGESGWQRTTG